MVRAPVRKVFLQNLKNHVAHLLPVTNGSHFGLFHKIEPRVIDRAPVSGVLELFAV